MKCDIVLAGVGGQGVLSISAIIAWSAMQAGLQVKQSEVHGMSQRGGAVQAHLRISDEPIASDLIPRGKADLILSMEPMEALRYVDWLDPSGTLVTAARPFENIANYPDLDGIHAAIRKLPRAILVESEKLAREAGSARASNMVLIGAAADLLPIPPEAIADFIKKRFESKGEKVVESNLRAFELGRGAAV